MANFLDSIRAGADALRGRNDRAVERLIRTCRRVMSARGDVSGAKQAKETLALYAELDAAQRNAFFRVLARDFAPDAEKALAAAHAYALEPNSDHLAALTNASEPPRQELLRRLNRAPGGTRELVAMREKLLDAMRKDASLAQVDADFRHLFSSWFNPGFLKLVRVDWNSPAALLEQLIRHEAVHEIRGWNDLRRRLQTDRRCFAFFHPVMPDEPLVFVEVALVNGMAAEIGPLIKQDAEAENVRRFDTAVFYSISNCQPGLRGVSLGNFLIKQVADQLQQEFPRIRRFCTLSPIPGLRAWVQERASQPGEFSPKLAQALKRFSSRSAGNEVPKEDSEKDLTALTAAYLLGVGEKDGVSRDPVARFHLHNGARLERLNWHADLSDKGIKQSFGMMVNYLYELAEIDDNHEQFVRGETVASKAIRALAGD